MQGAAEERQKRGIFYPLCLCSQVHRGRIWLKMAHVVAYVVAMLWPMLWPKVCPFCKMLSAARNSPF